MKQLKKQAIGFGIGTIGLGIASQVAGQIGGDVSAKGQEGMSNVAKFFPAAGTIIGLGLTLGALKELEKAAKKFRR